MLAKLLFGAALAVLTISACKRGETTAGVAKPEPLTVERGLLVASGLGAINGLSHTNTVEALRCNHGRGFRWFEVDLVPTADGELVGFHYGDEKVAGLRDKPWNLGIADVEGSRYADKFPVVRFTTLLAEADRLPDVVLVLDTDGWTQRKEDAVSRTVGYGPKHPTRLVLQVYTAEQAERIATLARELDAGLLLNLSQGELADTQLEELLKKHPFLAVVVNAARFTPWLSERLNALNVMLLVQTINDHRDIVDLMRAGADGFFTDRYIPYESLSSAPTAAAECGEPPPSSAQPRHWSERNLRRKVDYRLPKCAKRGEGRVELRDCKETATIRSSPLAVPPRETLHVELEAEAGGAPANVWIELVQKQAPKTVREREFLNLAARERKTLKFDVEFPHGNFGVETRLGVAPKSAHVIIHELKAYHGEVKPALPTAEPTSSRDAGE